MPINAFSASIIAFQISIICVNFLSSFQSKYSDNASDATSNHRDQTSNSRQPYIFRICVHAVMVSTTLEPVKSARLGVASNTSSNLTMFSFRLLPEPR